MLSNTAEGIPRELTKALLILSLAEARLLHRLALEQHARKAHLGHSHLSPEVCAEAPEGNIAPSREWRQDLHNKIGSSCSHCWQQFRRCPENAFKGKSTFMACSLLALVVCHLQRLKRAWPSSVALPRGSWQ